jgi:hypothetical protein
MMGMAPPLLVVTSTKGHMGWDEPVSDAAVNLPYNGRSFSANQNRTGVTGGLKQRLTARMLAESRACWQEPNKKGPPKRPFFYQIW